METNFNLDGNVSGTIIVLDTKPKLMFVVNMLPTYQVDIFLDHKEFLDLLRDNYIEDYIGDKIVLDYYVEDDDGDTYCQTYSVSVQDYIMNYISQDTIAKVLKVLLTKFTNQINVK
jgi:hypothetical protein